MEQLSPAVATGGHSGRGDGRGPLWFTVALVLVHSLVTLLDTVAFAPRLLSLALGGVVFVVALLAIRWRARRAALAALVLVAAVLVVLGWLAPGLSLAADRLLLIVVAVIAVARSARAGLVLGLPLLVAPVARRLLLDQPLPDFLFTALGLIVAGWWLVASERRRPDRPAGAPPTKPANVARTDELDTLREQLAAIGRINQILSLAPNLHTMFDGLRRETLALVNASGMSISLYDEEARRLSWVYGYEYGAEVDLSGVPAAPLDQGYSGHVARTGELLLINEQNEALRQEIPSTIIGRRARTWLGLPLLAGSQLVGVLAVESAEDANAFSEHDINLLSAVASPFAVAISNQQQYDQIEAALAEQSQYRLRLQTAAEVAAVAGGILDLAELTRTAVQLIKERYELAFVAIYLVDDAHQVAALNAATDLDVAADEPILVGDDTLVGAATADGRTHILADLERRQALRAVPALAEARAAVATPLRVRGRTIGALSVQSASTDQLQSDVVSSLRQMSDQIAIAIENARLLQQTTTSARRERLLNEVSARMHRSADVDTIIGIGLRALSEELDGAAVRLQLGRSPQDGREPPGEGDHGT